MRTRSRRTGLEAAALVAASALACADAVSPGTQVCGEILTLEVPGAELVEAWPGADGVALDYRIADEEPRTVHRIECLIAEPEPGSAAVAQPGGAEPGGELPPEPGALRARSIRIDGRELSEAELLLVNSELLLAEIRRADPGPPRSPAWEATRMMLQAGAGWVEETLSRLTREALATLDAWWDRAWERAQELGGVETRV